MTLRWTWVLLLSSGCLLNADSGSQGPPGLPGSDGDAGESGSDGLACWDVNGDGTNDLTEDANADGAWNSLDCAGPPGSPGDGFWSAAQPAGAIYRADGNVGIGTPNPMGLFHVSGDSPSVWLSNTAASGRTWRLGEDEAPGKFTIYDNTATAYRLAIDGNGNWGLGTTSPVRHLHVYGAPDSPEAKFRLGQGGANGDISAEFLLEAGAAGNGALLLDVAKNGVGRGDILIAPYGGNVGVGTSAPMSKLEILGDSDDGLRVTDSAGNTRALLQPGGTQSGELVLYDNANMAAAYFSSAADSYINGGSFGIGTTAPVAPLHVLRTGGGDVVRVENTSTSAYLKLGAIGGGGSEWVIGAETLSGTTAGFNVYSTTANQSRAFINGAGNVGLGTTTPISRLDLGGGCMTGSTCSDARLKTNVHPLEEPVLSRVRRLRAVHFDWKTSSLGVQRIGLIAQEVEEVFPEVVTTSLDGTEKGLECTGLNALLVEALKEQQLAMQVLESRLSSIEESRDTRASTLSIQPWSFGVLFGVALCGTPILLRRRRRSARS